jgi:hypothetical protein
MTVISISITNSTTQIVSGIPKTVSLSTNIPATIFYTLDGSVPTIYSTIYTGPIFLPLAPLIITLNIFATDGVNYSPIITEIYATDAVDGNVRLPHSATTAPVGPICPPDNYPFGTPPCFPNQQYTSPANAGITVYNPALPAEPTAFDGQGNPTSYTNEPYDITNYQIEYSTTNAEGEQGVGIGNLPGGAINTQLADLANVPDQGPETTDQFTQFFDPRAFVVFQDFRQQDPNDPPQINRQYFTLENVERVRNGDFYFNTGQDSTAPPSGSFIRSAYNPNNNTISHYYRDNWANRWIISTCPYEKGNGNYDGNLSTQTIWNGGKVFEWIPFQRRVLF